MRKRSRMVAAAAATALAGAIGLSTVVMSGLGAGPASASPANPGGIGSPAIAVDDQLTTHAVFELSPAHHVVLAAATGTSRTDLGGFAVDGLSATLGSAAVPGMVAVRGRDNAVWYRERTGAASWGPWRSLGGSITRRPAVAASSTLTLVTVVGADGRLYERVRTAAGWSAGWRAVNAKFTGTLALVETETGFLVTGRGADGRLWAASRGATADPTWSAFGALPTRSGLLLDDVNQDPVTFALYVRGADGACWTFGERSLGGNWESLGGRFEAGFAAFTPASEQQNALVWGRGLNHRLYVRNPGADGHWILFDVT